MIRFTAQSSGPLSPYLATSTAFRLTHVSYRPAPLPERGCADCFVASTPSRDDIGWHLTSRKSATHHGSWAPCWTVTRGTASLLGSTRTDACIPMTMHLRDIHTIRVARSDGLARLSAGEASDAYRPGQGRSRVGASRRCVRPPSDRVSRC